ncbi:hypothetical protein E4U14_000473 [Claviceps sp. LM454 group G7]|nr:hypothetical protein E4U14_000473 [Claviceps sp. LM454 group G7]
MESRLMAMRRRESAIAAHATHQSPAHIQQRNRAVRKALGLANLVLVTYKSPEQEELALERIMNDTDSALVVVLPTGGGKSLLFIARACLGDPGMTIVIVPYRSSRNRHRQRRQVENLYSSFSDYAGGWEVLRRRSGTGDGIVYRATWRDAIDATLESPTGNGHSKTNQARDAWWKMLWIDRERMPRLFNVGSPELISALGVGSVSDRG